MTDCYLSKINIHYKGLFCESILYKGDHIVPALDLKKHKVLPFCKFINHAWKKMPTQQLNYAEKTVILCAWLLKKNFTWH